MIKFSDIEWAAGFLEGEGCFDYNSGTPRVRAHQVQKQPLEHLDKIMGPGHFYLRKDTRPNHNPCWEWELFGKPAIGWMFTLWTLLSPRRREQIERVIEKWKTMRERAREKRDD